MSKLKKVLLMCTALVLVAALSIGGTVAYLQDDDSDVNVMTLGSVKIAQHEYQRVVDANGAYETKEIDGVTSYVLEDFQQGKPLLPIVGDPSSPPAGYATAGYDTTRVRMTQVDSYGSMDVFAGKNAVDKFVTVENTGKSDAYVRTLVAIEVGSSGGALIGTSYHQTWTKNDIGTINIDDNNYYVTEYVYAGGQLSDGTWRHGKGILPAGDTSYPSLSQVYIRATATNEDMVALDGNGNGTLDILVLSQAVQAEGFDSAAVALDAAFPKGTNNANVAAWFEGALTALPEGIPVAVVTDVTEETGTIKWNSPPNTYGDSQQLDVIYKYECPDEALCDPKYDDWYCDFYVSVSKDIDEGQIVLGGHYGTYGWIGFEAPAVEGNKEIALLASAFGGELVGRGAESDAYWTYANIKSLVSTFHCGVAEAIGADPLTGVTFTVNLSLTNPDDPSEYYNVNTVTYTFK